MAKIITLPSASESSNNPYNFSFPVDLNEKEPLKPTGTYATVPKREESKNYISRQEKEKFESLIETASSEYTRIMINFVIDSLLKSFFELKKAYEDDTIFKMMYVDEAIVNITNHINKAINSYHKKTAFDHFLEHLYFLRESLSWNIGHINIKTLNIIIASLESYKNNKKSEILLKTEKNLFLEGLVGR